MIKLIVCSDKYLLPVVGGVITLQVDDSLMIYVHRSLYDVAVVLKDRYETKDRLIEAIGFVNNMDAINMFYKECPDPINILAPFLSYINPTLETEFTFEFCVGALHTLHRTLDMRGSLKVEPQLRRSVRITVRPEDDYLLQWGVLLREWFDYDEISTLIHSEVSSPPPPPLPESDDMIIFEDDDDDSEMMELLDSLSSKVKNKDKDKVKPESKPEPKSEPKQKEELEEEMEESPGDLGFKKAMQTLKGFNEKKSFVTS